MDVMKIIKIAISDITIGQRVRREIGDLSDLAGSMKSIGLLSPIVLNSRSELVAGGRRIAAAELLGWEYIQAVIADTFDDAIVALIAERDENTCRKPLSRQEMVEVGRRLEEFEKPKASERKAATQAKKGNDGKRPTGEGKLPSPENKGKTADRERNANEKVGNDAKGKTTDKVAEAVGVSGRTYEKAKQVVEAAESDPETFGDLPEKMDAESVNAAHKEMKKRKEQPESPAAEFCGKVNRLCRAIDSMKTEVAALAKDEHGKHIHAESVTFQLDSARKALWQSRPTEPCNCTKGGKPRQDCHACFGSGLCPASRVLKGGR